MTSGKRILDYMTPASRSSRWDPLGSVDMLASLWSARPMSNAIGTSVGAGYRTLFETIRNRVLGRRVTIRLERGALRMTVTEFQAPMELRSLSVGQLGEVQVAAEDIQWNGYTLQRAHAVLHNVHLRPTAPPVMVAAPVEVSVELTPSVVDELLTRFVPRLTGQLSVDGRATLRWAAHPAVGSVEVIPHIDGSTLWLQPRAIIVRERRWALPRRLPPYPIRLPSLPNGLKLELTPRVDGLYVIGTLPEWNVDVPRGRLEKWLDQLDAVGRQPVLTWWGW
jgi:hypothetical protein